MNRSTGHDEAAWVDAPIPDSSPAVRLARLHVGADGALCAFVRFPAGWRRPVAGWYEVAEAVQLLEGDLTVGEHRLVAGDFTLLPARFVRGASSSTAGALAFARFGGAPAWHTGAPSEPAAAPAPHHLAAAPLDATLVDVPARQLADDDGGSWWWVERAPATLPDGVAAEVLDLDARRFTRYPAGSRLDAPTADGRLLLRLTGPATSRSR